MYTIYELSLSDPPAGDGWGWDPRAEPLRIERETAVESHPDKGAAVLAVRGRVRRWPPVRHFHVRNGDGGIVYGTYDTDVVKPGSRRST